MKVSILIVNWNSKDYLRSCLESVQATCGSLEPEIVVVDGGSFDGCDEMLAEEYPKVIFVQSPDNIGFARCNNLGFESVTGDLVILLNPDTELREGALDLLLEQLEVLPMAGIVCPRLYNTDGTLQTSSVQAFPTPLNQSLGSEFLYKLLPSSGMWKTKEAYQATEPVEVDAVSGACMVMRSELFRKLGGFTKDFFMYAEDMDLCYRARQSGVRIYHVPGAEVVHHGGGSSKTRFNKFSDVMMREALHRYMVLNHGRLRGFTYRCAMGMSGVVRMTLMGLLLPFGGKSTRKDRWDSIRKWTAILRWSLGMEPWANEMNSKADSGNLRQATT
ncbi:MAG: glycosyltransferase family 2 protein [Verrucomicrobiota bacterium]